MPTRRPPSRARRSSRRSSSPRKARGAGSRGTDARPAAASTAPIAARVARDAGRRFRALVAIMQRLRSPDGCPWDREQTLESLRGFVLEETYEVLDAIDRGDRQALGKEIGDLLFEGVFLAQIAAEEGAFTVADSVQTITDKLIRRHPHVFGHEATKIRRQATKTRRHEDTPRSHEGRPRRHEDTKAGHEGTPRRHEDTKAGHEDTKARRHEDTKESPRRIETPAQVLEQWEQIKAREQVEAGERRGVLTGMPKAMPALLRAYEIGTRVAAVGFDWARPEDVVEKVEEEVAEFRRAVGHESPERAEEEMGDLLFSVANLCRKLGIEPESALRKANEKFHVRFAEMERRFEARGQSVHGAMLNEMEAEWQRLKGHEGRPRRHEDTPRRHEDTKTRRRAD